VELLLDVEMAVDLHSDCNCLGIPRARTPFLLVFTVAAIDILPLAGRSDWLKGVQLLTVYLILGLAFFLTPES
jgi:Ca2+/H+ antiporter